MDVEGSEWESLEAMLEDGSLKNVNQLLIEIHAFNSVEQFPVRARTLRKLEQAGFRKFWSKINHYCRFIGKNGIRYTLCYEMSYINLRVLKEDL